MQKQEYSPSIEPINADIELSSGEIWNRYIPENKKQPSGDFKACQRKGHTNETIQDHNPYNSSKSDESDYSIDVDQTLIAEPKRKQIQNKGNQKMPTERISPCKQLLRLFNKYLKYKSKDIENQDPSTKTWQTEATKKLRKFIPKKCKHSVPKQPKLTLQSLFSILYDENSADSMNTSVISRQKIYEMLTDYQFISQNLIKNGCIKSEVNRLNYLKFMKVFMLRLRSKVLVRSARTPCTKLEEWITGKDIKQIQEFGSNRS